MIPVRSSERSDKNNAINSLAGVIRPSSPRQFFERIYGHLENSNSNPKEMCSPVQSELSSSPDLIDDR